MVDAAPAADRRVALPRALAKRRPGADARGMATHDDDEPRIEYTEAEWREEAERRFGKDPWAWKFVCPCCARVTAVREWLDLGAPGGVAFSCVGRWLEGSGDAFDRSGCNDLGCNYAGGGLFRLNPVTVTYPDGETQTVFQFAEPDEAVGQGGEKDA